MLNEDWDKSKQRFEAFWEREIIDRPCIQLYAPRKDIVFTDLKPISPEEFWSIPEIFYETCERRLCSVYYLGEAFPFFFPYYGTLAAMLGCKLKYSPDTIWKEPFVKDYRDFKMQIDINSNPVFEKMTDIVNYCVKKGKNKYFVGCPWFGNSGDDLATMRGYEHFCVDMIEIPEKIIELEKQVLKYWQESYNIFYNMISGELGGIVTSWLPVWSSRKAALVECDFMSMISPKLFQKIFLPQIIERVNSVEKSIFHLDGPNTIVHLDSLLDIPNLNGIQWQPGVKSGSMINWIPLLKKIQERKKCLYIECKPDEVEEILSDLSPNGLMIAVYCNSLEEAKDIMHKID